jgi:hypothetical protein
MDSAAADITAVSIVELLLTRVQTSTEWCVVVNFVSVLICVDFECHVQSLFILTSIWYLLECVQVLHGGWWSISSPANKLLL